MWSIPEVPLPGSADQRIPLLGFGTAVYPLAASEIMRQSIFDAIKLGYRHFDSAALYRSEEPLGEALAKAMHSKLIASRSDLFITSKLWCSDAHPGVVIPALKNTLKNLGVDYVDLYLIHWPISSKPGEYELSMKKEDLSPMDLKLVWEEMEGCRKLGLTRSIGVSNFSCKKLQLLLSTANIPPAVNQVEMNPLWQQKKLREFCKEKGIHVTAYSPLGAKGTLWGTNRVMECEVLHQIAKSKGKSTAQICLRWVYEQGVSLVVKSFSKERMEENLHIFGWELSMEELEMISRIPQRKGFPGLEFVSDNGPYKSLNDLWDGEFA